MFLMSYYLVLHYYDDYVVLEIKPTTLCMLDKYSISEFVPLVSRFFKEQTNITMPFMS